MNNVILDDDELQQYRIKEFLHNYLGKIITFFAVVAIAFGVYKYYSHVQETILIEASVKYERLLEYAKEEKKEELVLVSNELINNYSHTIYADFANLFKAKYHMDKKEYDTAKLSLESVQNSKDETLAYLSKLRLARLYLMQDKTEEAMQVLNQDFNGYNVLLHEILGDIHLSKKDYQAAKKAYTDALSSIPGNMGKPFWIEAKLSKLPEV